MTDRIHSLLVVLDKDVREDDIGHFVELLAHMRGVAGVEKCVSDPGTQMAQVRADNAWRERLIALLNEKRS